MKSKKINVWRGLSAVAIFLFCIVIFATIVANANAGSINNALGINASGVASGEGNTYYESDYGKLSDENLEKLIADETDYTTRQLEEGSVLLENNGALPLDPETETNMTLFGRASYDVVYKSICGGSTPDPARQVTMKAAFEKAGFKVNEKLYDAYASSSTARVKSGDETEDIGEEDIGFYTSELRGTFSEYNDVAVVVLSRKGGEGSDISIKDVDGVPGLSLHKSETDMLEMVRDGGFDKIVVLLNSVYPLEVGSLASYGVDAVLWIGNPGYYGLNGVVNVLTGKAVPSGHLVDTYAENSFSSAAMQNFGKNYFTDRSGLDAFQDQYVVYAEGIYVGYKYYETRYEDAVLGNGNADGSAGVFASDGNKWNYADEVIYPFGYGLSYTTFSHALDSVTYVPETDSFDISVTVTNTGDVYSGKDAVEVYVQTPYTDYDIRHKVEKSAVQLAAYAKTGVIEPGKSETVKLTFDRYLMASYDSENEKGYILDDGTYYFAVGNDVHDALNNILAAKGADGMYDADGDPADGNTACVQTYVLDEFDNTSYNISPYGTDNEVTNLFDFVDVNDWYDDDVFTYITRNDWQGTWSDGAEITASDKMKQALVKNSYARESGKTPLSECTYDDPKGIQFYEMIGLDFDDPKWDTFVKQLSLADLGRLLSENYGQKKIDTINNKDMMASEGPEGLGQNYAYGKKAQCTSYCALPVLAATWNSEMQYDFGNYYGEDALYANVQAVNGPGADIHRTPYGGRAAEYFSECGLMTYYVAGHVMEAMTAKGLQANIKHFVMNEQEWQRQGIATFAKEQCMREIYLRGFEGALTWGNATCLMTSYNRLGCTYAAANSVLQIDLLRGEWGFEGYIKTDHISESDYSTTPDTLINGNNLYGGTDRSTKVQQVIARNKDGDMLLAAQDSAHRILWAYANSAYSNGFAEGVTFSSVIGWWQIVFVLLCVLFGLLAAAAVTVYALKTYRKNKAEEVRS